MLYPLHRDERGKVNAVHYILALVLIAVGYLAIMYVPPWTQFQKIKRIAAEVALSGTTIETNDERNLTWFDSRMKEAGYDYPKSGDIHYLRRDSEHLEVSFEYDYPVKHFWGKTHVLHYSYRCNAERGHCM